MIRILILAALLVSSSPAGNIDLSIQVDCIAGEVTACRIIVENQGPDDAVAPLMVLHTEPGVDFMFVGSADGFIDLVPNGGIVWHVGALPAGDEARAAVSFRLVGSAKLTAYVYDGWAGHHDTNQFNNIAVTSVDWGFDVFLPVVAR